MCMRRFLVVAVVLSALNSLQAQDYSKWLFNVGGGIGFPQGDLGSFVNNGGHFVIGGGYSLTSTFGVDSEFMWHDLPINSSTKQLLQTPGASARQYSWNFNPIVHVPLGQRFGAYGIGGIGWYHRSGETTTPGVGVICDPYWSWWFGCTIGSVTIITGSRSADAFGENIGGGLAFRLGEGRPHIYREVRCHHASCHKVSRNLLPLTFSIRW
jgi:Outer membrane protein beta-barrel domain